MNDYVNIPRWLFVEIAKYFIEGDESAKGLIEDELFCKAERMIKRWEYEEKLKERNKKNGKL